MAEIVNLNKARKAKAKAEGRKTAEINRAAFGRTRGDREREAADKVRAERTLDGARRDGED